MQYEEFWHNDDEEAVLAAFKAEHGYVSSYEANSPFEGWGEWDLQVGNEHHLPPMPTEEEIEARVLARMEDQIR